MPKSDKDTIVKEGQVIEALPGAMFRVLLDDGNEVLGHLAGKMRLHYIKVLIGDRVVIEF
ncbi:MAG: translation initiation factor IF-1, partial [Patescibacteria group bacterium]